MVYNSPCYGYETGPELFSECARATHLVGFREFGGGAALTQTAEHITHADDELLLVGVDTLVFHALVRCGAAGAITGVGNCPPTQVLTLVALCRRAAAGDAEATGQARKLDDAMHVLASFDEVPDLVLYYKQLMVLLGDGPVDPSKSLGASQRRFAEALLARFQAWWRAWPGRAKG